MLDFKVKTDYSYIVKKKIPKTDYAVGTEVFSDDSKRIYLWVGSPRCYRFFETEKLLTNGCLEIIKK